MKANKLDDGPRFVPFDDENMEHVLSGPDYGQVDSGSKCLAWSELESKEYDDFVDYLTDKIIAGNKFSFFKSP